jgi:hypothetical protein
MNTFNELLAYIATNITDAGASYRILPAMVRNSFNWFIDLVRDHTEDPAIHTTQEDKDAITAHLNNNDIHLDPADKAKWDSTASNFITHNENTIIHVTQADKTNWNNTASNFITHNENTIIHVTQADKDKWNASVVTNSSFFLAEDTSNGTAINSASSLYPCYVGNGQIVYRNDNDGGKLYLKNLNDTSNGTAINSVNSYDPCYVGNGQIVYRNNNDGGKLYLKNLNDTSNGTAINSVNSECPCYVGNGQIVYRNNNGGGKLYLKNIKIYI